MRDTSVRAAVAMGIWVRRAIGSKSPFQERSFQERSATNATTTLASWHEFCGWVKATCPRLVISKSYTLQKDHTFNFHAIRLISICSIV